MSEDAGPDVPPEEHVTGLRGGRAEVAGGGHGQAAGRAGL